MVSIPVAASPLPRGAVRDVADWGRVVVATFARGLVATLLGMALWAAAPAVIGWHPTTVMTGSMEPRLTPGDVVVSRPVSDAALRQGQILLYDDPDQPGELRMHRFVKAGADGTIVTKGDANPQDDSTPVARSAVHGVAFLRIPYIGLPIVWMRDGEWHRVVLLALALTVLLWLGTVDGSLRRLAAPEDDAAPDDAESDGSASDGAASDDAATVVDGLEAVDRSAAGLRSGTARSGTAGSDIAGSEAAGAAGAAGATATRRAIRARARRARRWRRAGGALAVLLVAGGLGVMLPVKASAAAFGSTTKATASFTAGSVVAPSSVTCANNTDKTAVTVSWSYTGSETPSSFDVLNGGSSYANVTASTRSQVLQASTSSSAGTRTITIRTNTSYGWTATSSSVSVVVTNNGSGTVTARCA